MNVSILELVVLVILLAVVVANTVLYWKDKGKYKGNMVLYRKMYYAIVVFGSIILYIFGKFPFSGTAELLAFIAGIVILDLFLFQTPEVTKFMSSEFNHEDVRENIQKKSETVQKTNEKLVMMNDMVGSLDSFQISDGEITYQKYVATLQSYLASFTTEFNMRLYSDEITRPHVGEDFKTSIHRAYEKLLNDMSFSRRDTGLTTKDAVYHLDDGGTIEVIGAGQTNVIFPYRGKYFNILFVVYPMTPSETMVTGADAAILLTLMNTFDIWLESQQTASPARFQTASSSHFSQIYNASDVPGQPQSDDN